MQNGDSKREVNKEYVAVISTPRICSQRFLIGADKQDSREDFLL